MLYQRDNRTDNERFLEEELVREREQRERDQEREYRERETRRANDREEHEYEFRHPNNWAQAFRNQAALCWQEHAQYPEENEQDDYFKIIAEVNEAALKIWLEVSTEKQKQIEELQNQIRIEVAEKLAAMDKRKEWQNVASQIRDDKLDSYCDW